MILTILVFRKWIRFPEVYYRIILFLMRHAHQTAVPSDMTSTPVRSPPLIIENEG